MKRLERRTVLAGLGAAGLGACTAPFQIGEGKKPPKGGIGGTGIVGTLTDFGSLIVNGLRVETGPDTVISDAFGETSQDALKVGQVLTIEAAASPEKSDAALVARTVRINHPVIGPVQHVSVDGRRGIVAGVAVFLEDGAIGQLESGARVAVSGVWRGQRVIASRIERLDPSGPVALSGVLDARDGINGRIAGIPVRTAGTPLPDAGSFVTVVGEPGADGLDATRLVAGRFFGAAGPLQRLSVEGFLQPVATAPFFAVSGLGHSFDEGAQLGRVAGRRAIFTGDYAGDFVVSRALILPGEFSARRTLSARILAEGTAPDTLNTR